MVHHQWPVAPGHDLAHLLKPVLLIEGWWQGLAIFRGGSPYHVAGPYLSPCEIQGDQPTFILQPAAPDVIWHIYSGQHTASRDGFKYGPAVFRGDALTMGQVPYEF